MNKIPNENWQSYMLRNLCAKDTVVLLPDWVGKAVKCVGRFFAGLLVMAAFCSIPFVAFEIACALL